MRDQYGRTIDYMRVSITDRCNLRCRYCMPDDIELVPMGQVLTYEEIVEVCTEAAALGISKLKITGGEPLVRNGCPDLIAMLNKIPGIRQVTMTTNGVLLRDCLPALMEAGLDAVNISLDTLKRERYAAITGRDELSRVLESIQAALTSGLRVKLNTVLQQGVNDDEWFALASLAEGQNLDVRFIELMPIGHGKDGAGVSNEWVENALRERVPNLEEDHAVHGNGPAVYLHPPGWQGSVGFISAIHSSFCGQCNRIRLTAQGQVKPCLCYGETVNLMPLLRDEWAAKERKDALRTALREAIASKPKQHCFEDVDQITETGCMNSIGG